MNFFVLVAHCVLINLFVRVFGKFYIQFRVDRPKTLIRRIIGNDYWDQPQWRIYTCSNSTSINNDSAAVHCERIKPPWPAKRLRFWSFYVERLFFKTYRPLETSSVSYKFSDITVDQLPAEIWIGSYYASDLPYLYKTKDMFDFFESKTDGWLNIIKDKSLQENLVEYLAAPDVSWACGNPNITASYIKAYVAYMTKVILFYDSYMIEKDLKYNISDASLDWRGPTWLNWKLLKPVKKVYNRYKKGVDTMHELWLMNPESEGLLRKMIPVLTSKAMDPCFLQGVLSSFPEGSGMESYEYRGNPKDFLCTIYCRFSHVVSRLYLNSGSPAACALTGRGGRQNGGMCEKELCICNFSKRTKRKIIGTAFSTTFRYCMNVFNLRRYNETHRCRPNPT
nr:PREDICTED: uncharacterized protein LOC109033771 [Bemisia tabaci]